jgi:formate hydrogenlyase subunit 3/multisubunit Na+/H+ antiporter MnhD subunit
MLLISLSILFILLGSLVMVAGLFYVAGTVAREAHELQSLEDRIREYILQDEGKL